MFPRNYFAGRYFAPRYFPANESAGTPGDLVGNLTLTVNSTNTVNVAVAVPRLTLSSKVTPTLKVHGGQ